jgi:hypothetical protein
MANLQELPPIDPSVLANADPWVKLLFDRFDAVDHNNKARHGEYKQDLKRLSEQQTKTAADVEAVQSELNELTHDVGDAHAKIDKVTADFAAYKIETDRKYNDLLAKFEAKSSTVKVQVPHLNKVQQCSVEQRFESLLKEAKALKTIFVIGKVPKARPTISLSTLLKRHFEQVGAKLLPAVGKMRTRRFSVPEDNVDQTRDIIRMYNMAIRDLGYWIVQDAPPALRKMNSNAYAFFKMAKSIYQPLRRSRFEAEGGYVTVDDQPFLPVYMVSTKKSKWKALAALLMELVADASDNDWLEMAVEPMKIPDDFVDKWCAILQRDEVQGLEEMEEETRASDASDDEWTEPELVASGGG